jgi:uncharacterized protein YndB with AHSA1/START domain
LTARDTRVGAEPAAREIVITRIFDAPRELVFKAWTESEHMARWWGPAGYTIPFCTIDLRPGGAIHFCMRSPDGQDIWCKGQYREVIPPERIVCTSFFSDADGNLVLPTHYGLSADWPVQALVTVTFEEYDGKTKLTLRQSGVPLTPEREGAVQGWEESFDRLAADLAKA